MIFLFYLTSFLFCLGQLGRISFFNQQINTYLFEIAMAVNFFVFLIKYRLKPFKEAWKNYRPVFYFFGVLLFSLILNFTKFSLFENIVGFLYLYRLHLYFVYFFYLNYHIKIDRSFLKTIKKSVFLMALFTFVLTLLQYFFYPDLRNLIYQDWDPHLYRTFGVFFDTSIAASVFGILFLSADKIVISVSYLVLIALSFSRSAYLGVFSSVFYHMFSQNKFKKFLIFLTIFITFIFLIPKPSGEGVNLKRFYSIESRIEDYRQGFELWKNKPVFGYGFNRIRYIKNSGSIHSGAGFSSSFLTILVTSGIIGLFCFIWVLWSLRNVSKFAPILLIFLSITSLFDNILLHPFILYLLFTSIFLQNKKPFILSDK